MHEVGNFRCTEAGGLRRWTWNGDKAGASREAWGAKIDRVIEFWTSNIFYAERNFFYAEIFADMRISAYMRTIPMPARYKHTSL